MKFGIYLREPDWPVEKLQEFVLHVDNDLGYHGIYTNDHLTGFDKKKEGKENYLEAWTFMTAVLMWSNRLHAGHTVLCQSFRNPALLAKMVSTLDILSKGRFDLFLGAGWKEDEYLGYGYPFPSPGTRLQQLEEYVAIMRGLFDPEKETFDYTGKYWRLKNCRNFPKPSTNPFPIHLGGNGPRFIKMAARIADGYNTGFDFREPLPRFERFDKAVLSAGGNPAEKVKSLFGGIRIFKSNDQAIEYAKEVIGKNPKLSDKEPAKFVNERPWGTPEVLAEKIRDFINKSGVRLLIFSPC
ncbi:MAG: LLM class flavin-dependent oxidoreductase [Candidatus Hodarchaeales archaeon]